MYTSSFSKSIFVLAFSIASLLSNMGISWSTTSVSISTLVPTSLAGTFTVPLELHNLPSPNLNALLLGNHEHSIDILSVELNKELSKTDNYSLPQTVRVQPLSSIGKLKVSPRKEIFTSETFFTLSVCDSILLLLSFSLLPVSFTSLSLSKSVQIYILGQTTDYMHFLMSIIQSIDQSN